MREMLEGGELDVLTGDYLAELTMLILFRSRLKDQRRGYATTFLRQLEDCLGLAVEHGVRIVTNAGGLTPSTLAEDVRELADKVGVAVRVAHVEGDDLMPRIGELRTRHGLANLDTGATLAADPVTANAYLGGWGIAAALAAGADVVVAGRTTDAALVTGPAAWWHGWARDDWDALAGAVVAGHVLECGAQATGGNYSFFREVPGLEHVGFPLAEIAADGSSVITKHPESGGLVSVGTVTAQLLYEIGGPQYLGPDVTTRFDSIQLSDDGADRVRISGVRGEPPPPTTKVCINLIGGYRNSMTFLLTGLDIDAKAQLVRAQLREVLADVREYDVHLAHVEQADPDTNEKATATLKISVKDDDAALVGRRFSNAAVELALASYPGTTLTAPPGDGAPYGIYWPALVPSDEIDHVVVHADGRREPIPPTRTTQIPGLGMEYRPEFPAQPWDQAGGEGGRRVALGTVFGARSGDKGGNANVGVWARGDAGYAWLAAELTAERVKELLPETAKHDIDRYEFPNLRAVNFVIHGLLGEGVASSTRADPQAKGLGEWLRARVVELPVELLSE